MNFYEHHIGDWDSATAHLSLLEEAVYGRLIRLYYRTEKPVPADLAQACRLVRAVTKPERQAVQTVLAEFFVQGPDGWRQRRCDEEISRYREKCEKAGRSAKARWSQSERTADGMRTHSEGNALQSPDTRHQTPRGNIPPNPPADAPPSVELPPGLLPETWKAFRDHRQRLRAPLTPRAEKLLLTKLAGLCADGSDPNALVDRSIEHGWRGLFPLNGSRGDAADGIRQWLEQSTVLEGEFSHDA